ncbi:Bromodomain adjacent to zinc finger domain 1A [Abeliophyllum distichum]|uniref:Bromodomain adjacent to zinc finger domain 1A n=1 Tax=Abeliophyllum distichum TaxID=126358 RepID=A0ABD1UR48_9LAMI
MDDNFPPVKEWTFISSLGRGGPRYLNELVDEIDVELNERNSFIAQNQSIRDESGKNVIIPPAEKRPSPPPAGGGRPRPPFVKAGQSLPLCLTLIQFLKFHHLLELDLQKDAGVYNSKSFMKMLKKYELPPGYLYRVPNPSERIPGSDPREVEFYRDSMTVGLRFSLHPLFVSFFNEFHVTPGQLTPNSWRISTYFLYLCLTNNIEPCLRLFRSVFDMYPVLGSNCYAYIPLKVKLLLPHFSNSNSGWRRRFFFVRPEVGEFSFKTCWRTPFCKYFNEPLDLDHELKARLDKILSLKPPGSQMNEVLSNENLRRVHIGSPEDMDNFDLGGVMDVAGFYNDIVEDMTLSPLNKKKRRTDKGKATVETTVVPHSASHVTRDSDTRAYKEFGFPPVDSTIEAEIMLG